MGIYSCMNCDKRFPGCHASCPAYKAEKEKHDKEKAERDKQQHIYDGLYNQRDKSIGKWNKFRKKYNRNRV